MKRKILILGGTGPMGKYCQEILDDGNSEIIVTSREDHNSITDSIHFIKGDAMDIVFLKSILSAYNYDAIIDFMLYSVTAFSQRIELLLESTSQYIYLSSARVYAGQDYPMTEVSPRLLDICNDKEYLSTHEYALEKARCENILRLSQYQNYTIIRPYITYGDYRLQLGVLEKENWLYRALHGRSIVFSEDIAFNKTTMTYGKDVAKGIASIVGKHKGIGETYHITSNNSYTWNEILSCYLSTLEKHGILPRVKMIKRSLNLKFPSKKYQVIYCRYFNRYFDNTKIGHFVDTSCFTDTMIGLEECLDNFMMSPQFATIDWILEAFFDKVAGEHTPLQEIRGIKTKIRYLVARYTWYYELRLKLRKTR